MKPEDLVKGADQPPTCHCGAVAQLRSGKWGWWWSCPDPSCDSRVGCHKDTAVPLGSMAGPELRRARIRAHASLDALWVPMVEKLGRGRARRGAYRWMQGAMGLTQEEAHIAMMDEEQCEEVVRLADHVTTDDLKDYWAESPKES